MYFPGDPLFEYDPIFNSVRDEQARERMICAFDLSSDEARLGARVPLRHRAARARGDPVRMSVTPAQTVGPYFAIGLPWPDGPDVVPGAPATSGCAGRVLDGEREPIPDALIETWQADPAGATTTPGFRGFGRCPTDEDGALGDPHGQAAARPAARRRTSPCAVFARGLLHRVVTRHLLRRRGGGERRRPGARRARRGGARHARSPRAEGDGYRFDVRLQGPDETAFFAV